MLHRVFSIGLLGLLPILGSGCPCCSSADEGKPGNRGALGAGFRTPTPEEVKTYALPHVKGKPNGVYLSTVVKGGPADRAGLKVGDVLLSFDANKVCSSDDIEDFLRVSQSGVKVKALVKRGGTFKEEEVTVILGAAKADASARFPWQYAGLGQLDTALTAAKKDGKLVLVGLSGADT